MTGGRGVTGGRDPPAICCRPFPPSPGARLHVVGLQPEAGSLARFCTAADVVQDTRDMERLAAYLGDDGWNLISVSNN